MDIYKKYSLMLEMPEDTIENLQDKISCLVASSYEFEDQIEKIRGTQHLMRHELHKLKSRQRDLILNLNLGKSE